MRSTSRNIICEKQPFGGGRRAVFLVRREGSFVLRRRVHYLSPTGIISRLRARDGEFRAPARVTFFFCKKKVTKENHSNLRFKDPLARGGFRRPGGESVSPRREGGLRRPHFFLRRKKCGKESRLDLRSKDPLARGRQVQIWRCWLRGIGTAGIVVGSGDCLYLLRRCR